MVEACISLERFSFLKSRSPLRPGAGGSPEPSFGRTLFIEAQAFNIVPSTQKWSALSSFFTCGCASNVLRNSRAMSVVSRCITSDPHIVSAFQPLSVKKKEALTERINPALPIEHPTLTEALMNSNQYLVTV